MQSQWCLCVGLWVATIMHFLHTHTSLIWIHSYVSYTFIYFTYYTMYIQYIILQGISLIWFENSSLRFTIAICIHCSLFLSTAYCCNLYPLQFASTAASINWLVFSLASKCESWVSESCFSSAFICLFADLLLAPWGAPYFIPHPPRDPVRPIQFVHL